MGINAEYMGSVQVVLIGGGCSGNELK